MFTSRSKQIAANLRRAADVIEERGWTQGVREASNGNVCALGAIGIASGIGSNLVGTFSGPRKGRKLYQNTVAVIGDEDNVWRWNDHLVRDTGRIEVILRLRAQADLLDPKPAPKPAPVEEAAPEIVAGDIGPIRRRIESEPLYAPGQEPVHEPAAPAVQPDLVPA